MLQGVPRARGPLRGPFSPCQGAWGPETLEGSSCRGRIQLESKTLFCLQEQMDTRGATGVPVSWGRAGQSGGRGVQRGVPRMEPRQGPGPAWQHLGPGRSPTSHRPAPLCAKQLLPSQARTEPRLPSRQEGGRGACVREASAWQPPLSVFCPERGILVGLKDAPKAMPGPARYRQMGVWRGWVALAQIRSVRAHSVPPPPA